MTTIYPADPCQPPHAIAKTVRELRLEAMLAEAKPYLIGLGIEYGWPKLLDLNERIAEETK